MSSSASFDPFLTNTVVKQEDALHGFDHLLETLSDPETIGSSRQSWNLLTNPCGICLFRVEPNDNFTNLSLGSKVFIRRDLRMNFVNDENFPVDPKEIGMNPTLESLSQLRGILNHFTTNPQPKLKSSTHQLLQQAFDLLSKIPGTDEVLELIRKLILEAIATLETISQDLNVKTEPEYDIPTVSVVNIKTEPDIEDFLVSEESKDFKKKEKRKKTKSKEPKEKKFKEKKPQKSRARPKKQHENIFEVKTYVCQDCGRVFDSNQTLKNHRASVHDGPGMCDICGKSFRSKALLRKHMELHDSQRQRIKCPHCDMMLFQGGMRKHIRICHEGYKPYTCSFCGKQYTSVANLRDHEESHRRNAEPDAKRYVPKTFSRSFNFDNCPFQCMVCGFKFPTEEKLERHKKKHKDENEERQFKCQQCPLAFKCNNHLQSHIVSVHTSVEDLTFQCEFCPRRFGMRAHLNGHVKLVHERPNRFACGYCGERFVNLVGVRRHCKRKHQETCIYPCADCEERCKTLTDLKNHREAVHGDTIVIHKFHSQ